jgi:hypothetical protein
MELNKLVFGGLALGCLAAAAGGGFLAARQNPATPAELAISAPALAPTGTIRRRNRARTVRAAGSTDRRGIAARNAPSRVTLRAAARDSSASKSARGSCRGARGARAAKHPTRTAISYECSLVHNSKHAISLG